MCGRFTLTETDFDALAEALGVATAPDSEAWAARAAQYRPRYNVAPTNEHWVLRVKEGERELVPATWGLVNSWAKDTSGAFRQINARSETAKTRPAFRDAFERRRCVVPADGFFEWVGPKSARKPLWFHAPDGGLLRLAGLYESWRDPKTDAWRRTFTILTTAANDVVAVAHDRMPVILAANDVGPWLHGGSEALLHPAPSDWIVATPVSPRVNSVKNDDPECLEPAPLPVEDLESAAIAAPRGAIVANADRPARSRKARGEGARGRGERANAPARPGAELGPLFAGRGSKRS